MKKCPFCGNKAEMFYRPLISNPDEKLFWIECSNCPARMTSSSEKALLKAWNRTSSDTIRIEWVSKDISPKKPGWYYVRDEDMSISSRYFDDGKECWFHATAWDGFTPNNSFKSWLDIKSLK